MKKRNDGEGNRSEKWGFVGLSGQITVTGIVSCEKTEMLLPSI